MGKHLQQFQSRVSVALALALIVFAQAAAGQAPRSSAAVTEKARSFLTGLLDPALDLLPEYRGANVYWLYHDNYLAAKVLGASHPDVSRRIRCAMEREGVRRSGKIELLFNEALFELPFHRYRLEDVRTTTNKTIRTEVVTDAKLEDWARYADLLLIACIAETNRAAARQHWDEAMRLWDGKGFLDPAAKHGQRYSTYKLGLALLAASRLSPRATLPDGLLERLLSLQAASGGWITDYDAKGRGVGLANVETTCIAVLGIEAWSGGP